MKKFLAAIISGIVILSSSICFAAVDGNKILLAGISPGISESELLNTFGQPQSRSGDDWHYQNFSVEVEHGIVEKISTRSNAVTTPDGVRVGLGAEILNSTFGKADKVDNDRDGVEYEYYSTDRTKKIEFKVVNGVIAKISCKIND